MPTPLIKPTMLPCPWAQNGDKNVIPESGADQGYASWLTGWPVINQMPVEAGGIPPQRTDFNGALNALSAHLFWLQSGGGYEWSSTLDYIKDAIIWGKDGRRYLALQSSGPGASGTGPKDPTEDSEHVYWSPLPTPSAFAELEAWRKSRIGAPEILASPVLPDGYMWADGTLASFAQWPELKETYDNGKFEGYVLPTDATDEDKAAYPGKWVLAADSAGLYTPRLSGLFARYCGGTDGDAGAYGADTGREAIGSLAGAAGLFDNASGAFSLLPEQLAVADQGAGERARIADFALSRVWGAEHTGTEFAPAHYTQPIALYLGKSPQI